MGECILVADADVERGQRIAAACRALAMDVHVVSHGAAALEVALAEKPVALVAQLDLPLIDGERLAEILHANPHTCSIGMLFVSDGEAEATRGTAGRVIPGHADPDTVARFCHAMLQKRRPEPFTRAAPGEAPGVEGKLSQISLAELLELFHVNRKTGVIELRRGGGRRAEAGSIRVRGGDVIQAETGEVTGEKALFRMLGWRRGGFAFREERCDGERSIDRPTRALLREAERQEAEWERLGDELPPAHARVTLKVAQASLPNALHPLTQEVLLVLEQPTSVQDVLDRVGFPDYQVLRTLQMLVRRGLVELRPASPGPEATRGGLLPPARVVRLRDWLEQGRSRDAALPDAKVVVIASDPEARQAFASLMRALPGVELPAPEERTPRGDAREGTPVLRPLLRIAVDDDLALEWIEVPAALRWAPAWPLAVHGALATLFVHGGDASVSRLRDAIDVVAAQPRARSFHLFLEEKDESDLQSLCEQLSLFDDRSVASLSPERPDEADRTLRQLLARLLP